MSDWEGTTLISYIFSVENGRDRVGKRAVTIMINSDTGEFMGIRTSGYETLEKLEKRPLLWERGANAVPEDVATPTISTIGSQQGDEDASRTKGQSNVSSTGKVSETSASEQENGEKNESETAKRDREYVEAIGAKGKPVIIKKNIFEKNANDHQDLTADQSREILSSALYNPNLYGQNKKASQPYRWVVINTKDAKGKNRLVLLEVNETKDNVEVVHWHYLRENALETLKRQTKREGGLILILPSSDTEEAGGLSSRTSGLSSAGKVSETSASEQENAGKNSGGVFRKGYRNNKKEVWSASEAQNKQSATDNTLWKTDKSDSPETPNGNVSNSSTGKVSETSETAQENARKKWEVAIPI